MAKNLQEFLLALAKKSGLKVDEEKVDAFLKNEALATIEVPDEFTAIDSSLITVRDAMNNHPEISRHYKGITLKPVDKKIENLINELGLDKDAAAEIIGETNSYERIQMFAKAIQAHESKKGLSDKEARSNFQKQIDQLQAELRASRTTLESEKENYGKAIKNFKLAHAKGLLFNDYKTVYDDLPSDVKMQTLSILLDKRLAEKEAVIDFDGDTEVLTLKKKDGTNYYSETNTPVNHKQFIEQLLADNKLIKATAPANGGNGNTNNNGQNQHNHNNGNGGNGNNSTNTGGSLINSLNQQAIKDMQQSSSPF